MYIYICSFILKLNDDEEDEEDEEEDNNKDSKSVKSKIYVPPRLTAVHYGMYYNTVYDHSHPFYNAKVAI